MRAKPRRSATEAIATAGPLAGSGGSADGTSITPSQPSLPSEAQPLAPRSAVAASTTASNAHADRSRLEAHDIPVSSAVGLAPLLDAPRPEPAVVGAPVRVH